MTASPHPKQSLTKSLFALREELYTDVRINDTLCERYQLHMGQYGRKVLKRHEKVLTASSDIGRRLQRNCALEPELMAEPQEMLAT